MAARMSLQSVGKTNKDEMVVLWLAEMSGYQTSAINQRLNAVTAVFRSFKALNKEAIYEHLSGKHVLGLYPILKDDHCWILAADFAKANWQADVIAFLQACNELITSVLIERSRFGNGVHVGIFLNNQFLLKMPGVLGL